MRAFAHGLMLAGLPVLAFLGVDYLITPPAANGIVSGWWMGLVTPASDAVRLVRSGADAPAEVGPSTIASGAGITIPPAPQLAVRPPAAESGAPAKGGLVAAIQDELRRVGCYAGQADGTWNDQTRSAMLAFNSSVHVNLGTDRPDYILLTLLQGHSSKACSRSCEGEAAKAASCVDKSIEARTIPLQPLPSQAAAVQSGGEARFSSVVVPAPILAQRPAAPAVANVGPVQSAPASASPRKPADMIGFAPPTAESPPSIAEIGTREAASPTSVFADRMSVGAPPNPAAGGGTPPATAQAPRPKQAQAEPSRPRATPASSGGSRLGRTFSDLSSSSP